MAAQVDLTTVWLNTASDVTDARVFATLSDLSVATEQPGEVRRYANGRRRLVKQAGTDRGFDITFVYCDRSDVDWLQDRVGELLLIRDDRGRKVWGSYLSIDVKEASYDGERADEISFTFAEVTHSEEV